MAYRPAFLIRETEMKTTDVLNAYIAGQFDSPKRKPMDGDRIREGFDATGFTGENFRLRCFIEGVRWAEEYHGIGGGDD